MIGVHADEAFLQHNSHGDQVAKMRQPKRLPPLPRMADRIDVAERFYISYNVHIISREESLTGGVSDRHG